MLDILKLVCEVTCKNQSVRNITSFTKIKRDCATECDCTTNILPICDIQWDEESIDNSCTSTASGLSVSCNLDSTCHFSYEDDDELNDSQDMHNEEPNNPNTISFQNCDCIQSVIDDEDNSSVEEMYSDFKEDHVNYCNNDDTDNLVPPGDVLEYCTVDCNESAGQSSVDTIIEGGTDTYVVLKNGIVLHPKRNVV